MKRWLGIASAILLLGSSAAQADFLRGMDAYGEGDYETAVREFRKAGEQGDKDAMPLLGMMYLEGRGVARDDAEGARWIFKAALQGDALSQTILGTLYVEGRGVEKDTARAAEWYLRAAGKGDVPAQLRLGGMYVLGEGVPQDYVRAYMWFNVASVEGRGDIREDAKEFRDSLTKQMTSMQIAEGQRLTRECAAKKYRGCW